MRKHTFVGWRIHSEGSFQAVDQEHWVLHASVVVTRLQMVSLDGLFSFDLIVKCLHALKVVAFNFLIVERSVLH